MTTNNNLEELWNSAIHALSELRGNNIQFKPWLVKAVVVQPPGLAAHFHFLDETARAREILVELAGGPEGVEQDLKVQLEQMIRPDTTGFQIVMQDC